MYNLEKLFTSNLEVVGTSFTTSQIQILETLINVIPNIDHLNESDLALLRRMQVKGYHESLTH